MQLPLPRPLLRTCFTLTLALAAAAATTATATGCAADEAPAPFDGPIGHILLPLESTSAEGVTYVLSGATFVASGPVYMEIDGDADTQITVAAPFGDYQVSLNPGWQLNRRDPVTGALTPVVAQLASQNPQPVRVQPDAFVMAQFNFLLGNGTGQLILGVNVSEQVDSFTARWHLTQDNAYDSAGQITGPWTQLAGSDVTLLARFGFSGWFSGELSDGRKYRVYSGYPAHFEISEADLAGVLTGALGRLDGGSVSLSLIETPGAEPTDPKTIAVTLNASNIELDQRITYMVAPGLSVPAYFDADGFPTLSGSSEAYAPELRLEQVVQDVPGQGYRISGSVQGTAQIFLNLPLS
jgi:hypothetical protein